MHISSAQSARWEQNHVATRTKEEVPQRRIVRHLVKQLRAGEAEPCARPTHTHTHSSVMSAGPHADAHDHPHLQPRRAPGWVSLALTSAACLSAHTGGHDARDSVNATATYHHHAPVNRGKPSGPKPLATMTVGRRADSGGSWMVSRRTGSTVGHGTTVLTAASGARLDSSSPCPVVSTPRGTC
jgi:phosphate/sulfate permease